MWSAHRFLPPEQCPPERLTESVVSKFFLKGGETEAGNLRRLKLPHTQAMELPAQALEQRGPRRGVGPRAGLGVPEWWGGRLARLRKDPGRLARRSGVAHPLSPPALLRVERWPGRTPQRPPRAPQKVPGPPTRFLQEPVSMF